MSRWSRLLSWLAPAAPPAPIPVEDLRPKSKNFLIPRWRSTRKARDS